jgi:hypothetical protein
VYTVEKCFKKCLVDQELKCQDKRKIPTFLPRKGHPRTGETTNLAPRLGKRD